MNKSELLEIAKELDRRLPNFFGIVYEKYEDEIKKWIGEQREISMNSDLVYQYIRDHIISILNKDFNDFIKTASLELLYGMDFILNRIDVNSFPCDEKGENYAYYNDFNGQSFVNIVERFKEFDLPSGVDNYKYPLPKTTPYDAFEYSGEELDFSHNESVWGKKVNDNLIKEFFFDEITLHNIHYDISIKTEGLYKALLNKDFNPLLKGLVKPKEVEVVLGHAEVRRTFKVPRVGTVAGCYVTDGKIVRNGRVRVLRNGVIVAETSIGSLKRFKDDVREVVQGFECGVGLENFHDIKEGDILEVYTIQEEVA